MRKTESSAAKSTLTLQSVRNEEECHPVGKDSGDFTDYQRKGAVYSSVCMYAHIHVKYLERHEDVEIEGQI